MKIAPAAESLKSAAEAYFAKEDRLETASSCQRTFLDSVLDYCAALGVASGDGKVMEKSNKELMDMYCNFMKEKASQSQMLKSASDYCKSRMSVSCNEYAYTDQAALPARCWPALLSSSTARAKGPNPLTRAQTMEKGDVRMISLEEKRYTNLEVEGCRLLALFRQEDVEANIRGEKYEFRAEDTSIHVKE